MALDPNRVDELYEAVKEIAELWIRVKKVYLRAFASSSVTREQEAAFLQIKSDISRAWRSLKPGLPRGLDFSGDKMVDMLRDAMNMEHLTQMAEPEREKSMKIWHGVFILMERSMGAMEVMKKGYYPHLHRPLLKLRERPKARYRDFLKEEKAS